MLNFLRNSANSVVIKILMIILAMTFVLWGVGDVLRQSTKLVAFKVGDHEYSELEWQKAYSQQLSVMQEQLGKSFTEKEAKELGLNRAILNQLINRSLLSQEAKRLGILVSDDMVKYEISTMPMFIRSGKFDKEVFERVLRNSGMTEQQFITILKEDMATQNLSMAQTINKEMPATYLDTLLKAKGEMRSVKLFRINASSITLNTPKEDELKQVYESNIDKFSVPEQRDISYFTFGIENTKPARQVTDDELKEHYKNNTALYTEPERRKVFQMIFTSENKAQEAVKLLAGGKSFDEVTKQMFPDKTNFLLGDDITEKSFDQEISEAIFKTEAGKISPITKTPMGWHVFKIDSVKASKLRTFDEVKTQLAHQFEEEMRFESLTNLAQEIDQEITMGSKLADLASKYSLKLNNITNWKVGEQHTDVMAANQRFSSAAFSTDNGNLSSVTPYQGNDKFFVLEVSKVVPKTPRAFIDVKADVVKIWEDNTRTQLVEQKAKDVLAALKAAQSTDDVVKTYHMPATQSGIQTSLLDTKKSILPDELKEEIFKLDIGKFTIPVLESKHSYVIAQLERTVPLDQAKLQENRKNVELELIGSVGEELMSQYLSYLRSKYKVTIYEDVIKM